MSQNTGKMLLLNQSTSENNKIFWKSCDDFVNIDVGNQLLECDGFVYADSQIKSPNMAIKRSLKVADSLKYLDSLENTIINCAPIAEMEETHGDALDEEVEQIYMNNSQQNFENDIIVAPLNDLFLNKLDENTALFENPKSRINEKKFKSTIKMLNDGIDNVCLSNEQHHIEIANKRCSSSSTPESMHKSKNVIAIEKDVNEAANQDTVVNGKYLYKLNYNIVSRY